MNKYRHKKLGWIAISNEVGMYYCGVYYFPKEIIENSSDWELIN